MMVSITRKLFIIAPALVLTLAILIGCQSNGSNKPPIMPDDGQSSAELMAMADREEVNSHHLLLYNLIHIDATDPDDVKAEIIPVRLGSIHLNILKFLEFAPCTDCFKIAGFNFPQPGVLDVDIVITHPFDDLNLTVFDVRGIIMFNGSRLFPESCLTISDSTMGDGVLLNAEGFTQLYKGSTLGMAGDFFSYYQGKLATPVIPNADLNGFIRHISDDPSNTRNALLPADSVTRTYSLAMPAGNFVMGYAVDASWDIPAIDPVTDPMAHFPATANCIEPWMILVTEEKDGDGLTPYGGQTKLIIDVYDWQGKGSHLDPLIECPEIFNGQPASTFSQDGDGYARYEVVVSNNLSAPLGTYRIMVSVEDAENESSPEWTELIAYSMFDINVNPPAGPGCLIRAKHAGGPSSDSGYGIARLSDNSTVVTGYFRESAIFGEGEPSQTVLTSDGDWEIFLARYNPDGALAWAKRAGGMNGDSGFGITNLPDDSIVVTGCFSDSAIFGEGELNETVLTAMGPSDIFVARYNPDGTLAWAKSAGGSSQDIGLGITALPDCSTVTTGYFRGSAIFGEGEPNQTVLTSPGGNDIFIARYNPDGSLAWAKGAGGVSSEAGNGITILSDNSVVVTGYFSYWATFGEGEPDQTVLESSGGNDIFVARYNPDGALIWAKSAGGIYNARGNGITALSDNSFVLTGYFNHAATFGEGEPNQVVLESSGSNDLFVARYNPDGALAWARLAGGVSGDSGEGIAALSDDSFVVTGYFRESATFGEGEPNQTVLDSDGDSDVFIAWYNPDGTLVLAKRAGGVSGDSGKGIATLTDDSTVVTGYFCYSAIFGAGEPNQAVLNSHGEADIFIARFNP